jgi:formylglycine-generating enzyme required for sulfatase activity
MGTPAYMSPEQARGDLEAMGPAADVYSLGAILYSLLAGHPPYAVPERNLNAVATWGLLQAGAPEPIHERAPEAPAELCAICEKAMAREPGERYASMQDLGRDLRAYLDGRVVAAYETGAVAEFRKWVRRNRALALTAFGAGLVIVSGLTAASVVLARKNDTLASLTLAAEESARLADERATAVLRLADVKRLQQLRAEAASLWPAHPENVSHLEDWLRAAGELLDREDLHRAELARLRSEALPSSNPETGRYEFLQTEDQWQHDTLAELVEDLEQLRDPRGGLVADIEGRLAFAQTVRAASIDGPEANRAWILAADSIADVEDCPAYRGLAISPQLGLLPLGRNERTGLWEFAHLQTGEVPERDPATDELVLTGRTGLVFVLVPGGTLRLGAQADDPDEPGYDPGALIRETPPREVHLDPFFVSKYEMTQGQWQRFTGANPSYYGPGDEFESKVISLLNPVEQVSAGEARDVLARLVLELPTEAQWEYAARAGTTTPWSTGAERESLEGYANLADQSAARAGATWTHIADWPELDDGFGAHAPVDALKPNPFGLHHVHGNLWEWCRDEFVPGYLGELREGDGLRLTEPTGVATIRGGSFQHAARHARSANRNPTSPDNQEKVIGVRPVRRLDP